MKSSLVGHTLSHYRITAAIGAGGMGEVYRATDTNLDRAVAIKVLPPEVAQDEERLARFRREAHLLASLNHPNIAAIYGLEESGDGPFLALELVEGEDLKERLARGRISIAEAIEIGEHVAAALEEAHGRGIVHRDLKPANVKLTPDGKVKVLDFGLAKAWGAAAGESSSPEVSQSPTLAQAGTMAGVILGTAAYMAPEQARGRPVDKRADIWSFGVLMWELLTGRVLFDGETISDVVAAVLTREPDLAALPEETPPAVRRLIGRCLRKDPRTRLPDIGAARLELQEVRAGTTAGGDTPAVVMHESVQAERRRRRRERWLWVAVSLALAGLAGALVLQRNTGGEREPRSAARFVLDTPDEVGFRDFDPVAMSPDGRHVVFTGVAANGGTQLYLHALDALGARALAGTEGGDVPFWSPDGRFVGFAARRSLLKLAIAGGAVQRVCALPTPEIDGGTWNADGTIVFAESGPSSRLYAVPAAGGEARPLTSHDASRGERSHSFPQFLPDGRHLLYSIASEEAEHAGLHVLSLEAPAERRRVLPSSARFQYVAPGHLLSVRAGVLSATPFDPERFVATGEPVPLASPVAEFSLVPDWGWFSGSSTGRVAWVSGSSRVDVQLTWIDRTGQRLGTVGEPGRYGQIALAPDNRRAAVEVLDAAGRYDLWVMDLARGVASRLTSEPTNERDPVWSPDSQRLVFSSDAQGDQDLLWQGLSGSDVAAPLPGGLGQTRGERDIAKSWHREGNVLLHLKVGTERTLWAVSLDGGQEPDMLLKGFGIDHPMVSPDGRWLAYISTESGRYEVYVESFRRRGAKVRVSVDGGGQPRWRSDSKELFYLSSGRALMAVSIREGSAGPEVGMPATLVGSKDAPFVVQGQDYSDYAVSADGQRILVKLPVAGGSPQRLQVLLDWPSLLEGPGSSPRP